MSHYTLPSRRFFIWWPKLFPELKGEVRRRLLLSSAYALSLTCHAEHALAMETKLRGRLYLGIFGVRPIDNYWLPLEDTPSFRDIHVMLLLGEGNTTHLNRIYARRWVPVEDWHWSRRMWYLAMACRADAVLWSLLPPQRQFSEDTCFANYDDLETVLQWRDASLLLRLVHNFNASISDPFAAQRHLTEGCELRRDLEGTHWLGEHGLLMPYCAMVDRCDARDCERPSTDIECDNCGWRGCADHADETLRRWCNVPYCTRFARWTCRRCRDKCRRHPRRGHLPEGRHKRFCTIE